MEEPRYEHDCDDCTFLGNVGRYDAYVHIWPNGYRNWVFRSSSYGPDYQSGDDDFMSWMMKQIVEEERSKNVPA